MKIDQSLNHDLSISVQSIYNPVPKACTVLKHIRALCDKLILCFNVSHSGTPTCISRSSHSHLNPMITVLPHHHPPVIFLIIIVNSFCGFNRQVLGTVVTTDELQVAAAAQSSPLSGHRAGRDTAFAKSKIQKIGLLLFLHQNSLF